MAPAEAQVATSPERRRSERWPLALPLVVRGVSLNTKSFQEETFTLSISAHGARVALATTVTLGQTLFLRNPETQDEAGAWVTRFGLPHGGLAQVGIEFVRPDADFWSNKSHVKPPTDGAERRTKEGIHVLACSGEKGSSEVVSVGSEAPQSASPEAGAPATLASPEILLYALGQTLRQAAEHAVAEAAIVSLGGAVNQAAAAIDNFSHARVRQIEERLAQYREELTTLAREDFSLQIQADAARSEEHLRKRAEELVEDAARRAHGDFVERLRVTADQMTAQFVEHANDSSVQLLGRLGEQIQAAANQAQTQIDSTAAGLNESQENARGEIERLKAEVRQTAGSLTSQAKDAYADCEARLRVFQDELAKSKERELEHFRERLRSVLTTLLGSLA
jgi:hypothetical protein